MAAAVVVLDKTSVSELLVSPLSPLSDMMMEMVEVMRDGGPAKRDKVLLVVQQEEVAVAAGVRV